MAWHGKKQADNKAESPGPTTVVARKWETKAGKKHLIALAFTNFLSLLTWRSGGSAMFDNARRRSSSISSRVGKKDKKPGKKQGRHRTRKMFVTRETTSCTRHGHHLTYLNLQVGPSRQKPCWYMAHSGASCSSSCRKAQPSTWQSVRHLRILCLRVAIR